jgi:transcriptional regulator with XRE-family HTH domain
MKELNEILKELGISKVKLAKYLGVSRQMIYNYLEMGSLDEWPKDKKMRMFMLLNINSTEELVAVKVTSDYILKVENILSNDEFISLRKDLTSYDLRDLNKKYQQVIVDVVDIMKEQLNDDKTGTMIVAYKYLCHFLHLIDDLDELKYVLGYFAKANGYISPKEFAFNEEKQTTYEGIMFQAMTLFYNGGASKSKIIEAHKRFVSDIEQRNEEKLSRTQELNAAKAQALKELGYTGINDSNASDVFAKIAEIHSRKHPIN